jgi:protein gp37
VPDRSKIEWTEVTWNPVTGCDRISAGCDNCYALTLAKRLKAMGAPKYQNDGHPVTSGPGFGVTIHPATLDAPRAWRAPRTVFVNSMSDLFHARVPLEFIAEVFAVIAETPRHTYQLLTKRPARVRKLADALTWPPNLWLGVSIEDDSVTHRLDDLKDVPAALRFLSCEPLLGPLPSLDLADIDWVIVGGDSGPGARTIEAAWVTEIRDQCLASDVPFFFKQWGGRNPKSNGRALEGRQWDQMPAVHQAGAASV